MKKKRWHGMNWIRKEKRERIYERDGHECVWCGWNDSWQLKSRLTLDHLIPRSCGGSNHESNLVTSCKSCNDKRADLPLEEWVDRLLRNGQTLSKNYSTWLCKLVRVIDSGRKGGKTHGLRKSA